MRKLYKTIKLIMTGILLVGILTTCQNTANLNSEDDSKQSEDSTTLIYEEKVLAELAWDINLEPIGADISGTNSVIHDEENNVCSFNYNTISTDITYSVNYNSENVKKGLIEITAKLNNYEAVTAVTEAGTYYLSLNGDELTPTSFAKVADTDMKVIFENDTLVIDYTDTYEGVSSKKKYSFNMKNKTLVVHAQSDDVAGKGGYSAFSTGKSKLNDKASINTSVHVEEVSVTIVDNSYFLSTYLDKAKTFGTKVKNRPTINGKTSIHGMTSYYQLNSAEETNPLNEYLYITVSDNFLDCVYLTNAEKSEYRDMLNNLIIYDTWEFRTSYSQRKSHYEMLAEKYGMKDIMLIDHRWQRDTLDISNPVHYPASSAWGSLDSFRDYVDTVMNDLGWMFALHEDYWFIYPSDTNQYWNMEGVEDKIAQDSTGKFRLGWQTTSYANKSDAMLEYSNIESNLIKENYGTDAAFLDVNGGIDPSDMNQVTLNAESDTSRTIAQVVADNVALFNSMKKIYKGPIMSEGAQGERSFASAYAGHIDASEREITGCYDCRIMPDYELKYIRPLMANQGMGYPARFQPGVSKSAFDFDKYNAASIAYGHTGFIGEMHDGIINQQANTYYMFRAIQEQYLNTDVTVDEIAYFDIGGAPYNLNEAIKSNYDFTKSRLYIKYSNGLEIYLNFSGSNWTVNLNGNEYVLDKNGYAAENISIDFVQYSCLIDGVRVDYVDCNEYIYANPRNNLVNFGNNIITDQMTIIEKSNLKLNVSVGENYEIGANNTGSGAVNIPKIQVKNNGDYGLYYYAASGTGNSVALTPMILKNNDAFGGKYWSYLSESGREAMIAPIMYDGIGVADPSDDKYPIIGLKAPETGTMYVYFSATSYPAEGSDGYTFKLTKNGFETENEVVLDEGTHSWIPVKKGDMIYFVFKNNGISIAGDRCGYYAYFSYTEITE